MENRAGLMVGAVVSHVDGLDERSSALRLLDCLSGGHAKTVGADKAYDIRERVAVVPHNILDRQSDKPSKQQVVPLWHTRMRSLPTEWNTCDSSARSNFMS